jgi:hypothetical protein
MDWLLTLLVANMVMWTIGYLTILWQLQGQSKALAAMLDELIRHRHEAHLILPEGWSVAEMERGELRH